MGHLNTTQRLVLLLVLSGVLSACASTPTPQLAASCERKVYQMPQAMREIFRGGEMPGMGATDSFQLGTPTPYDMVSHTCVSTPITGLDGRYVRTEVRCW